jgi:hypothetical protein
LRDSFEDADKARLDQEEKEAAEAQIVEATTEDAHFGGSSSSNDPSSTANDAPGASTNTRSPKCPACNKPVMGGKDEYLYCKDCDMNLPMHEDCMEVHNAGTESEFFVCCDCHSKYDQEGA